MHDHRINQGRCRAGARSAVVYSRSAALLALCVCLLSACHGPLAGADRLMVLLDQQAQATNLLPALPAEVARAALLALDQGDLAALLRLLDPQLPDGQRIASELAAHWPRHTLAQPRGTLGVGPYQARQRLGVASQEHIEVIPIRASSAAGTREAVLWLQSTRVGWRIVAIHS